MLDHTGQNTIQFAAFFLSSRFNPKIPVVAFNRKEKKLVKDNCLIFCGVVGVTVELIVSRRYIVFITSLIQGGPLPLRFWGTLLFA